MSLCTDKTGTLTEDLLVFGGAWGPDGSPEPAESGAVARYAFLNSFFQTGLRNFLDAAFIEHADQIGLAKISLRVSAPR